MDQLPLLPLNKRTVGLSNILDSELTWRTPCEGPYGKVIGAAVMDGELLIKIVQRVKAMTGVKAFLVLPVAALHLAVVAGRVGADQLVPDSKPRSGQFKLRRQVFFTVGETVGKLKTIVCLHAFHLYAAAFEPGCHFLQEISCLCHNRHI